MNIGRLFRQLYRQIFRTRSDIIYLLPCNNLPELTLPESENLVVLDEDNIGRYAALCADFLSKYPANKPYITDISKGRIAGFFILVDGEIVHYGFLFLRNRLGGVLGLPGGVARVGNSFTSPVYRGRGCQGRSILARAAYARQREFEAVAAETSPDNLASQRGMEKAGMTRLGRLDLVVILRFFVIRWHRPVGFALFSLCP